MVTKAILPFVRSPYNYDTNQVSNETGIDTRDCDPAQSCQGAKQSFKEEVDINNILKQYGLGYEMPTNPRTPQEGDFIGITTYRDAMHAVRESQEMFNEYPANIRTKFDNDPEKFVQFTIDPKNREEMKELGMLSKEALERDRMASEQRLIQEQGGSSQKEQKPPTGENKGK